MKRKLIVLFLLLAALLLPMAASAAGDLDEILNYTVTAEVNEDATVTLLYHIEWKVLDSSSEGPLEWVTVGIPNSHYSDLTALSDSISKISYTSSGGSSVRIDLDRKYYAGEVAVMDFSLVQDYMYQVNELTEGETVYHFTPGWFDSLDVDEIVIRWNGDKALGQAPACIVDAEGYYVWTDSLSHGQRLSVTVTYPAEAYAFDETKTLGGGSSGGYEYDDDDDGDAILGFIVLIIIIVIVVKVRKSRRGYTKTSNLSGGTKVTRTKVVYYPVCQGCGAPRPENANNCPYCGRSFIKSEEVIKAEDIPKEERELRTKTTSGLYRYHSQPDTYIRVRSVPIIVNTGSSGSGSSRSGSSRSSGGSSRGGGSSHSSCASSHCACASSCACACACACAGGGRAGCTTKDFYNTDLKLRQLELKKRAGRK